MPDSRYPYIPGTVLLKGHVIRSPLFPNGFVTLPYGGFSKWDGERGWEVFLGFTSKVQKGTDLPATRHVAYRTWSPWRGISVTIPAKDKETGKKFYPEDHPDWHTDPRPAMVKRCPPLLKFFSSTFNPKNFGVKDGRVTYVPQSPVRAKQDELFADRSGGEVDSGSKHPQGSLGDR